jgi:hypothetical protein
MRILAALSMLCLSACPAPKPVPQPPVDSGVAYAEPARVDLATSGLPRLPSGNLLVTVVPGGSLQLDPTLKDPITALATCAQWVFGCFEPTSRSLDACVASVPDCQTQEPWLESTHCCPTACKTQYQTLRDSGGEPYPSLDHVLFEDGSCLPGVNAQLGRP